MIKNSESILCNFGKYFMSRLKSTESSKSIIIFLRFGQNWKITLWKTRAVEIEFFEFVTIFSVECHIDTTIESPRSDMLTVATNQ